MNVKCLIDSYNWDQLLYIRVQSSQDWNPPTSQCLCTFWRHLTKGLMVSSHDWGNNKGQSSVMETVLQLWGLYLLRIAARCSELLWFFEFVWQYNNTWRAVPSEAFGLAVCEASKYCNKKVHHKSTNAFGEVNTTGHAQVFFFLLMAFCSQAICLKYVGQEHCCPLEGVMAFRQFGPNARLRSQWSVYFCAPYKYQMLTALALPWFSGILVFTVGNTSGKSVVLLSKGSNLGVFSSAANSASPVLSCEYSFGATQWTGCSKLDLMDSAILWEYFVPVLSDFASLISNSWPLEVVFSSCCFGETLSISKSFSSVFSIVCL